MIIKRKLDIPRLEEVKKGIDELLLIDKWDSYKIRSSPRKFRKRFDELFLKKVGILPYIIMFSNSDHLPFKFYRLRKWNKTMNETLISEYSYPPNRFVKSIQRASIPYHPVFYCSDNPLTAIYETIRTEDNINPETSYYLSQWSLMPGKQVRVCPFLFGNVHKSNPYSILSDNSIKRLKEQLKDQTEDEKKSFEQVLKFLSQLFIYDNSYIVSSYIAHSNLYAGHNMRPDVFIYPSVQTEQRTVNFAIHPNAVSEKLQFERVFELNVMSMNKKNFRTTAKISRVGKNVDGVIMWERLTDQTEEGRTLLKEIDVLFSNAKRPRGEK